MSTDTHADFWVEGGHDSDSVEMPTSIDTAAESESYPLPVFDSSSVLWDWLCTPITGDLLLDPAYFTSVNCDEMSFSFPDSQLDLAESVPDVRDLLLDPVNSFPVICNPLPGSANPVPAIPDPVTCSEKLAPVTSDSLLCMATPLPGICISLFCPENSLPVVSKSLLELTKTDLSFS